MLLLAKRSLIFSSVFLAVACSTASLSRQTAAPAAPQCVIKDQSLSSKEKDAIAELRRTVEAGPLYIIPASQSGIVACNAGYDAGGITLEYSFRDRQGWLRVKRDPRIEYNDQELRFELPPAEVPMSVLKQAELAAFGKDGCGIEWKESEKQQAEDDPQAVETIFRGDTCNCQARIRSDASGRVIGLRLRSAC